MDNIYDNNAKIFKALSDPNRLQIINILSYGEKCACRLLEYFDFTQPTLSHHMKVLMECGLVNSRKEGTWNYYSLNSENANEVLKFLDEIISFKEKYISNNIACEC